MAFRSISDELDGPRNLLLALLSPSLLSTYLLQSTPRRSLRFLLFLFHIISLPLPRRCFLLFHPLFFPPFALAPGPVHRCRISAPSTLKMRIYLPVFYINTADLYCNFKYSCYLCVKFNHKMIFHLILNETFILDILLLGKYSLSTGVKSLQQLCLNCASKSDVPLRSFG